MEYERQAVVRIKISLPTIIILVIILTLTTGCTQPPLVYSEPINLDSYATNLIIYLPDPGIYNIIVNTTTPSDLASLSDEFISKRVYDKFGNEVEPVTGSHNKRSENQFITIDYIAFSDMYSGINVSLTYPENSENIKLIIRRNGFTSTPLHIEVTKHDQ